MPILTGVTNRWNQVASTVQARLKRPNKGPDGLPAPVDADELDSPDWADTITPTTADIRPVDEPGAMPMQPGMPPGVFANASLEATEDGESGNTAPENPDSQEAQFDEGQQEHGQTGAMASADDLSDADDAEELNNPVGVRKVTGGSPRVKTMVEAIPVDSTAEGIAPDILPDYLMDVFKKKVIVDPRIHAFLIQHGTVDIHELVQDLRGLAVEAGVR